MAEQLNELAAALAKAQAEIRAASKDATNPHFKSKYADLASIWDACRDPLTKNGLSVLQLPSYNAEHQLAAVRTILLHASGQAVESTLCAPVQSPTAQGVGSALTYLRRYALAATVGVAPDDDDGEASVRGPAATKQASAEPAGEPRATDKQMGFLTNLMSSSVIKPEEREQLQDWMDRGPTRKAMTEAIDHWKATVEKRKAKLGAVAGVGSVEDGTEGDTEPEGEGDGLPF